MWKLVVCPSHDVGVGINHCHTHCHYLTWWSLVESAMFNILENFMADMYWNVVACNGLIIYVFLAYTLGI